MVCGRLLPGTIEMDKVKGSEFLLWLLLYQKPVDWVCLFLSLPLRHLGLSCRHLNRPHAAEPGCSSQSNQRDSSADIETVWCEYYGITYYQSAGLSRICAGSSR